MRETPTWRIPFGIVSLFLALMLYAVAIARYAPGIIGGWSGTAQTVVYLVLGLIWLLPMLSPPLVFPVGRIAPLLPVLLIVLLAVRPSGLLGKRGFA